MKTGLHHSLELTSVLMEVDSGCDTGFNSIHRCFQWLKQDNWECRTEWRNLKIQLTGCWSKTEVWLTFSVDLGLPALKATTKTMQPWFWGTVGCLLFRQVWSRNILTVKIPTQGSKLWLKQVHYFASLPVQGSKWQPIRSPMCPDWQPKLFGHSPNWCLTDELGFFS